MNAHTVITRWFALAWLCLLLPVSVPAQKTALHAIDPDQIMQIRHVEVVYISPSMLKMVPKASLQIDGKNALNGLIDQTTSMYIFTSSDRQAIRELRKSFAPVEELRVKDLEQLMYVKSAEGIINFVGQIRGDIARELYLFVSDDDEYTVISLTGRFPRKLIEESLSQESKTKK